MSDSKAPLSTDAEQPQNIQLPGSPPPQTELRAPTTSSVKRGPPPPLVDVDVVPEDPTPEALELVVAAKDTDNKRDSFDETEPLLSPPEFTEYVADSYTDGSGNIVSHDKHLNEDGKYCLPRILPRLRVS